MYLHYQNVHIKVCSRCGGYGPFHKSSATKDGLAGQCATCVNAGLVQYRKNVFASTGVRPERAWRETDPRHLLFQASRARAKRDGLPHTITRDDIRVPALCPMLGIPLKAHFGSHGSKPNSPSVDKFVPSLGYVPGNVWVISHKANRIKSDATPGELRTLSMSLARLDEIRPAGPCSPKQRPDHRTGLLSGTRQRAKRAGIEYSLTPSDIDIPDICPLLHIPLRRGVNRIEDGSPTIDRIDSSAGYIPGNVWVVSHKANRMKTDASAAEVAAASGALDKAVLQRKSSAWFARHKP